MDSPGLCLFPLRKMTGREQTGGAKRIIGGGDPNCFGGEVYLEEDKRATTDVQNGLVFFVVSFVLF